MSAGYVIAQLKVTNPENYKEYVAKVNEVVKKFGGEYIVRNGEYLVRAGEYKVIPVNPTCINDTIHGERVYGTLLDIKEKVDIVDVFRPSEETIDIANQTKDIGAHVLWLQLNIENDEAKEIAIKNKIYYIANKCTKIEFQKLFGVI